MSSRGRTHFPVSVFVRIHSAYLHEGKLQIVNTPTHLLPRTEFGSLASCAIRYLL